MIGEGRYLWTETLRYQASANSIPSMAMCAKGHPMRCHRPLAACFFDSQALHRDDA